MSDETEHPNVKRSILEGAVHRASDAVHQITGRTDLTLQQVCEMFPEHADVAKYKQAVRALKGEIVDA